MESLQLLDGPERPIRRSPLRGLKLAWLDLWNDLKQTRWLVFSGWFGLLFWLGFLLFSIIVLPSIADYATDINFCRPDNTFALPSADGYSYSYSDNTYSVWRPSNPFEVTMGFGNLSFGIAKLVDVIWDVVCLPDWDVRLDFFTNRRWNAGLWERRANFISFYIC